MARFLGTIFSVVVLGVMARMAFRVYLNPADWSRGLRVQEARHARENGFGVAIVWPLANPQRLLDGVHLALEELNARGGPWAGKIHLLVFDEPKYDSSGAISREVARHHDVVAVIGHKHSETAIPASVTYENHGILFLAPMATTPDLTLHGFQYVFRTTPDADEIARCMTDFAASRKFHRIGVLYARTAAGTALALRFVTDAPDSGIAIPFVRSYPVLEDEGQQDFRPLIAEVRVRSKEFDALALADSDVRAARFVLYLRQMGVMQPILGSHGLDSDDFWNLAQSASANVFVASLSDPDSANPAYQGFKRRFRVRYGRDPEYGAEQGYRTMNFLINALEKTGAADPLALATTLRSTPSWPGLFTHYSFTPQGDMIGGIVAIKEMRNGVFSVVYRERPVNQSVVPPLRGLSMSPGKRAGFLLCRLRRVVL